jgi:ABC-type lipopolysaccharide export system ATPase subunit
LFEGTPSQVLTNEDVRRVYLGARFAAPGSAA